MEEVTDKIKNFMSGGILVKFPAKLRLKLYCIYYLSGKIENGREYSEKEINQLLNLWHSFEDPAELRRYLCDYGFLSRTKDGAKYWLNKNPPTLDGLLNLLDKKN